MRMWRDGRSGPAGCTAGNLVLAHLEASAGETFHERKGTTFRSRDAIWVGRVCSTDAYLSARDRHWANLSWGQHQQVVAEARRDGAQVKYLFITVLEGEPVIHYWVLGSGLIDEVAFAREGAGTEFVYSLHIRENGGRYEVDGHDVTKHHYRLRLEGSDARRMDTAFEATRAPKGRRATGRKAATGPLRTPGVRSDPEFQIPVIGGRTATLTLPQPAARVDIERIKGWLDLMADVLTATPSQSPSVTERRARASLAVQSLRARAAAGEGASLTAEDIDDEIAAARGDRHEAGR